MKLKTTLLALMTFFANVLIVPAAFAEDLGGDLTDRVFFATDREQRRGKDLNFGGQVNEPSDHMSYGLVSANSENEPGERTWCSFNDMASNLRAVMDEQNRHEFVIFVHGCCVSFKEAAKQAGQLQEQVHVPVVMYDWGSPLSYQGSILSCPRGQERFNTFMSAIAKEFPHEKVALVGLSMGGILIDNFFLQHRPSEVGRTFDQVVFARTDMDSVAFRTHLPKIAPHARKTFIYADNKDRWINLSAFLRVISSPFLHGERVGRLKAALHHERHVQVIDVTPLNMNHRLPCTVVADFFASDGNYPLRGKNRYVKLANGLWQAQPRKEDDPAGFREVVAKKDEPASAGALQPLGDSVDRH